MTSGPGRRGIVFSLRTARHPGKPSRALTSALYLASLASGRIDAHQSCSLRTLQSVPRALNRSEKASVGVIPPFLEARRARVRSR